MAAKIRKTRPELKRYRQELARYERYLPMLKLKQQQLQVAIREVSEQIRSQETRMHAARQEYERQAVARNDYAGVDLERLATPAQVHTGRQNVAGVSIQTFREVEFPAADYSLFITPPWVDRVLAALRNLRAQEAHREVLQEQRRLVQRELRRIVQRVNLFEKVKIPQAQEAIRVIRIQLGDEMTAAVGRAKIAKQMIEQTVYAAGEQAAGASAA
jgi:V/A-type H+/Na+-transporting ATPase subunit D